MVPDGQNLLLEDSLLGGKGNGCLDFCVGIWDG